MKRFKPFGQETNGTWQRKKKIPSGLEPGVTVVEVVVGVVVVDVTVWRKKIQYSDYYE